MADTQPYRPRKRGYESAKDMLWSLIPIVVLVMAFVYFCGPRSQDATTVDPRPDITSVARAVDYPFVAPLSLSKQWKPTASTALKDDDGAMIGLSIGYLTPADDQARFVVSTGTREAVLKTALANAKPVTDPDGAAAELGELSWVPVRTSAGRALVAEGDGFIAVVAGTASYAELRELAGAVGRPKV